MFAVLVLLFVVFPIAELYVIVQVAHQIGVVDTLGLLLLVSLVGAWLVKRAGMGVWRRVQLQLAQGTVPSRDLVDGLLVLVAGVMMLAPGFITDVLGLSLLFPPVRALVRSVLGRRFKERTQVVRATYAGRIYDVRDPSGGVRDTTAREIDRQ
ncbi:MAG: FxsA family protein [Acidimicrobiia bacterium]